MLKAWVVHDRFKAQKKPVCDTSKMCFLKPKKKTQLDLIPFCGNISGRSHCVFARVDTTTNRFDMQVRVGARVPLETSGRDWPLKGSARRGRVAEKQHRKKFVGVVCGNLVVFWGRCVYMPMHGFVHMSGYTYEDVMVYGHAHASSRVRVCLGH